jgi:hypothetical protein
MARGKGIKRKKCHCRYPPCGVIFLSTREDSQTCSAKCRKAWNRLLGGPSLADPGDAGEGGNVTDLPDGPHHVYLDGEWKTTKPTRAEAEAVVASWLEEWDGEFTIEPVKKRAKR